MGCQFFVLSIHTPPDEFPAKLEEYFPEALEVALSEGNEENEELMEELYVAVMPLLVEKKLPSEVLGPQILVRYMDVTNFCREITKQLFKLDSFIPNIFAALKLVNVLIFQICLLF